MNDEGESVAWSFLPSDVVNSDLGVRDTSVVSRFWIWFASAEPVAPGRSSTHL